MNVHLLLRREVDYFHHDRLDNFFRDNKEKILKVWPYIMSFEEVRQKIRDVWLNYMNFNKIKISDNVNDEDWILRCDDDDHISSNIINLLNKDYPDDLGLISWSVLKIGLTIDNDVLDAWHPHYISGLTSNGIAIKGKLFNKLNLHQRYLLIDDFNNSHRYVDFSDFKYLLITTEAPYYSIYLEHPFSTWYLANKTERLTDYRPIDLYLKKLLEKIPSKMFGDSYLFFSEFCDIMKLVH